MDKNVTLLGTVKNTEGKELKIDISETLSTIEAQSWAEFINNIISPLNKLETASLKVVDKNVTLLGTVKNTEGKELKIDISETLSTIEAQSWAEFTNNIISPLNKLETASLKVVDKNVTLLGTVKSTEGKELTIDISEALTITEAKKWAEFINNIISPLNKLETASLKVVDKNVTLLGTVKNTEGKELKIDISETLNSITEAKKWAEFTNNIISPLNKLETASLKVVDNQIILIATIKTTKNKMLFLQEYKTKGYEITSNITAFDEKIIICKNKFNTFLKQEKIIFNSGTSIINDLSERLIFNLYETAKSCSDSKINIIGHTDSIGMNEANEQLSLERAEAVVRKLSDLGLDRNRLHAIGKGESSPIAENSTKEGQEKNRRIEFEILGY